MANSWRLACWNRWWLVHCSGGKINWLRFSTNRNEHLFYQSTIFLPESSPVKQATGKPFLNQAAAVSSACLEAIQLLHQVIFSIFVPKFKKLSLVHWQVMGTSNCLLTGCIESVLTKMSQRALHLLSLKLPSESFLCNWLSCISKKLGEWLQIYFCPGWRLEWPSYTSQAHRTSKDCTASNKSSCRNESGKPWPRSNCWSALISSFSHAIR